MVHACWPDEIEDFRFDVTHLPGARNPTEPLLRRGRRVLGDGPALSTGYFDPESQLFSRLGRDAPAPALLAAIRVGWASTRRAAAAALPASRSGAHASPHRRGGEAVLTAPGRLGTPAEHWGHAGSAAAGTLERPRPLTDVRTDLGDGLDLFRPIRRGAAAALGRLVDLHGAPVTNPTRMPKGGPFLVRHCLL